MKFQTLSLVAGTQACNAKCPFCVSRMTGLDYIETRPEPINQAKLKKALRLAVIGGVTTAIITGKGEPTLFPQHIDQYLEAMESSAFPFIELQTNGSVLELDRFAGVDVDERLRRWAALGLTTILLSNVGYDAELNHRTYFPHKDRWIDLAKVVARVHAAGINVRLTTVGISGGVDAPEKLRALVAWAQSLGVKQLTWRPVAKPTGASSDDGVAAWVHGNGLRAEQIAEVRESVERDGTLLYRLVHGAAVYDLHGMNLCISNCLTHDPEEETVRQLIFYPDGGLYTDWVFKGSVLL